MTRAIIVILVIVAIVVVIVVIVIMAMIVMIVIVILLITKYIPQASSFHRGPPSYNRNDSDNSGDSNTTRCIPQASSFYRDPGSVDIQRVRCTQRILPITASIPRCDGKNLKP